MAKIERCLIKVMSITIVKASHCNLHIWIVISGLVYGDRYCYSCKAYGDDAECSYSDKTNCGSDIYCSVGIATACTYLDK